MQLCQPEALGMLDHHHRRIGHVDAYLDHCRRDQHVDLAADESVHHRGLVVGLHPAVQQPDLELGERRGELRVQRNRGLQLELLRFLDQRTNPVDLLARGAELASAQDDLAAPALADQPRRHWRAPRRHFVDHRHVEIGVKAHRQRARDRRGAHHELMRVTDALLAQREPLRDAKAVLLVDDGEPQRRQRHLVLEQGVGADRELRFAAFDRRLGLLLRFRRKTARQPGDLHRQAVEPRSELAIVLLGEDFGRGHERHLATRLDRLQRRQRRDHRLAAADVALQEPLHRLGLGEIAPDFRNDALLRPCQRKRQPRVQRTGERRVARQTRSPAPRPCAAVDLH